MAAAQIVFVIVSLLIVDNLGRRIVLMVSSGILTVCCFAMGLYFYFNSGVDADHSLDWIPVVVSCVYVMGFSIGLGPVPWLFVGEIFPDRVKGLASSVANTANWLAAFLVTKFFPTINETLGVYVSFWVFGACCLAGVAVVFFFFPETKGRTLDEIQDDLNGRKNRRTTALRPEGLHGAGTEKRRYGSFDSNSK
ncbi:hypothetical protein FOCC_FOCC005753, partial [Frankliniella occidentalis]